jgi:hypothetical protein
MLLERFDELDLATGSSRERTLVKMVIEVSGTLHFSSSSSSSSSSSNEHHHIGNMLNMFCNELHMYTLFSGGCRRYEGGSVGFQVGGLE